MKITIISVGKIKEKFYKDAIFEYSKRLSRYCKLEIFEVIDEKTPENANDTINNMILEKEGERIRNLIKEDSYIFSLAIEGKKYDSIKFANKIENLGINGKSHITFIIGGSLGIQNEIKNLSNELISFSDMTFPHQLMRVILLEQLYRTFRITNHEPYHK